MKDVSTQDMTAWRKYEWLDYLIESWKDEWLPYCERCKQEIKDNIKVVRETNGKETTIILVTHHVPHEKLNLHASPHFYNAYSGVKNFLGELRREGFGVDYAICGHTHRRNVGAMIEGTLCVNVGDSNLYPYEHFVFEI